MGKIFSFFILKGVISSVIKPITTLLILALISVMGLALLEDLSTNGLVEVSLALFIKWVWLCIVIVITLKLLTDVRDGLSSSFSFSKKVEEAQTRHEDLIEKPVLLRRQDVIAKKYSKKR
ncbi:hypothetical protein [Vibrio sp. PNB22_4_1]